MLLFWFKNIKKSGYIFDGFVKIILQVFLTLSSSELDKVRNTWRIVLTNPSKMYPDFLIFLNQNSPLWSPLWSPLSVQFNYQTQLFSKKRCFLVGGSETRCTFLGTVKSMVHGFIQWTMTHFVTDVGVGLHDVEVLDCNLVALPRWDVQRHVTLHLQTFTQQSCCIQVAYMIQGIPYNYMYVSCILHADGAYMGAQKTWRNFRAFVWISVELCSLERAKSTSLTIPITSWASWVHIFILDWAERNTQAIFHHRKLILLLTFCMSTGLENSQKSRMSSMSFLRHTMCSTVSPLSWEQKQTYLTHPGCKVEKCLFREINLREYIFCGYTIQLGNFCLILNCKNGL